MRTTMASAPLLYEICPQALKAGTTSNMSTVRFNQECPSSSRWSRKRQLQQLHLVRPSFLRPSLHGLENRLWHQDHHLLRPFHQSPNPSGFLDCCLDHVSSQERKGSLPRSPDRTLPPLPPRVRPTEVPRQEQDPNGDLPRDVL